MTGPDGYATTHAPAEGRVTDGEVEWTGRSYFGQRESVAFARGDDTAANLWTSLSLALRIGGVIYGNLVRLSPAWLLFGVLLSGLTVGRRFDVRSNVRSLHRREAAAIALATIFGLMHLLELLHVAYFVFVAQVAVVVPLLVLLRDRTPTVDRAAAALLAFGFVVTAYPIYDSVSQFTGSFHASVHFSVFGVGVLYLLTGALARQTAFFEGNERRFERLFAPLAVVPVLFVVLFFGTDVSTASSVTLTEHLLDTLKGVLLALSAGLFLPLGYRSHGASGRETAALAAGIFAGYLLHVSLTTEVAKLKLNMGIGASLDVVIMAVLGLAIVVFGLPLYFLGRALAAEFDAN